ncbi:ParB/RepB/Spo0J family partition protein [uncultured Fenollaria sp.]|uniref:ParB/RepB/Spo0J family partition protein n=1 Tax=uncultured Fenollaria sp. TaxID=1686315 RepID=UPI0025D639C1|nr:ParB/RepB/Spo0J family partition protein [uncultured Fenollaria sp.]
MAKKLGKGLGSLLGVESITEITEKSKNELMDLEMAMVVPTEAQPRQSFKEDTIKELAESIEKNGLLQPIVVRPMAGGKYQIIAGERRYRAFKKLGRASIPAIVRDYEDEEVDKLQLVENVQREDLNPYDEAIAYLKLKEKYGLKQDDIAKAVGKSRPYISNMTRLLSLEDEILEMLKNGEITVSHAKLILSVETKEERLKLAHKIKDAGLTVKKTEENTRKPKKAKPEDIYIKDIRERLEDFLSTKVAIKHTKRGGSITIDYYTDDDLTRLTDLITED